MDVYSVETSLLLNDRMVVGLRAVARELRGVQTQVDKLKTSLNTPTMVGALSGNLARARTVMAGIASEARRAATAMRAIELNPEAIAGTARLSRSLGTAAARAATLRAELAGIRMPAGGLIPPRGPGGREPGGRTPFFGRFHKGPIGAHFGLGIGDMIGVGAGAGMVLGLRDAMKEQTSLYASILATGMDPSSPEGQRRYRELLGLAEQTSRRSFYTPSQVTSAWPGIFGLGLSSYDKTLPLLLPATRYAETSQMVAQSQGKNVSIEDASQAAIRMAHVLGVLDPDKMEKILNLALVAQFSTGKNPGQLEKTMMYFGGTARLLGMSPEQSAQFGAISSAFLPGTTAGTALNNFLLGMLKQGGPGSGTKIAKNAAHLKMLKDMGLVDSHGKTLLDPLEIIKSLAKYRATHPGDEVAQKMRQLFNIRGMREAEALSVSGVIDRYLEMVNRMGSSPDAITMQRIFAGNTLQGQLKVAWANLQSIFNAMSQGTLPGLITQFDRLNAGMDKLRGALWAKSPDGKSEEPTGLATALGYGAEGLTAITGYRLLRRLLGIPKMPLGRLIFGTGGRAGAALGGAEGLGAAAAGSAGLGLPGLIGAGLMATGGAAGYLFKQHTGAEPGWAQYLPLLLGGPVTSMLAGGDVVRRLFGLEPDSFARRSGTAENRNVSLTGTAQFSGDIHLNLGQLGSIIEHAIAHGIMRAGFGGTIGSTGAPDMSGGLAIPSAVY